MALVGPGSARWCLAGVLTALLLTSSPARGSDPSVEVEGGSDLGASASVGVFSQYVFRGFQYGRDSAVVQPSVTLDWAGFSAALWANLDADQHATQSFAPDRPGEAQLNELDVTLSYARELGPLTLGAGWTWYGTRYADETHEVFVQLAAALPLSPTLTVYRDVDAFPATYASLALTQAVPLLLGASLELSASAGLLLGDSDAYRTADALTGEPGELYRALHDGLVGAAIDVPVGPVSLRPSVQWIFPLSGDARREGFSPAGHLEQVVVWGATVAAEL